ncbi:MAG: methylmalonyl Co-A mutase-associated GTPase MeaB [Leeuwenhoekiella sp.]
MSEKKNINNKLIDYAAAKAIIAKRKTTLSSDKLAQKILAGDRAALSQGITRIESQAAQHQQTAQEILSKCILKAGKSIRIGITGVPGVGKSTFIENFGNLLTENGHKVAVLAIDPSSSKTRGSILGDKTRMATLTQNPDAFIRPSAAGESLGGVARKTRESIILCEAAGYDVILIETVGVGQSETAVHQMTDFFLLLKLPGAGDELQGIKRGIIELADLIVINKADGKNIKAAQTARDAFAKALHLYPKRENGWQPKAQTCSAQNKTGLKEVLDVLETYFSTIKNSGFFEQNRKHQNQYWLKKVIDDRLHTAFYSDSIIKKTYPKIMEQVINGKLTPFQAAEDLLKRYNS